jgi:hypothetical protein
MGEILLIGETTLYISYQEKSRSQKHSMIENLQEAWACGIRDIFFRL